MKKLIKRIAALFAAGCIFMMNGLMLTVSAEEQRMIDKGYWEYETSTFEGEDWVEKYLGMVTPYPYTTTWTLQEGTWSGRFYVSKDTYNAEGDYIVYKNGDTATATGSYSVADLHRDIQVGDTVEIKCKLNSEAKTNRGNHLMDLYVSLTIRCQMEYGKATGDEKDYHSGSEIKVTTENGGESISTSMPDKTFVESSFFSEPIKAADRDSEGKLTSDKLRIIITYNKATAIYQYKWHENLVPVSGQAETTSSEADDSLWIIQNESKNALDSAGEDSGTEINPAIITGKKKYDDRPSTAAEKALAAAGGAGVATAAALAASNNSKKKKISYKMLISKDFGDTLEPWQEYTVYARIVQVHNEAGLTRNADEYTRQITAFSDNMPLNSYYHTPSQRFAATFKVTDDNADKATLSFQFKGKGGVFTEHVTFKVKSTEKNINFVYFNSDGSIGEIFDKYDDVRPHGLFLGENAFSTLYIYTTGFSSMPELTCECDSFMLRPTAVPLPNFNTSPKISEFAKRYPWYNDMVNAKFFKVDLNNKTQKSPSMFGKYPLNTNVTFTAKSERGAAVSRTLPVFIVPKGFYIDIDSFDERQKSNEYIELYTNELVDVNRSQLRSTRIPVNIGFAYIGEYRRVSRYHDNNRLIPVERVTFDSGLCKDEYTPTSAAASNIKLKKEFFFETSYSDYNDVYSDRRYYIGWHRDEGHSHNAVMEFCPTMPLLVNNNTDELLFDLEVYYEAINTETQALMDKHDIPLKCKVSLPIFPKEQIVIASLPQTAESLSTTPKKQLR